MELLSLHGKGDIDEGKLSMPTKKPTSQIKTPLDKKEKDYVDM